MHACGLGMDGPLGGYKGYVGMDRPRRRVRGLWTDPGGGYMGYRTPTNQDLTGNVPAFYFNIDIHMMSYHW